MKNDRQRRILEIVEREPIDTQEQLQQKLQERQLLLKSEMLAAEMIVFHKKFK